MQTKNSPKIIDFEYKENFSNIFLQKGYFQKLKILKTYNLPELKIIFYDFLEINIPFDILLEYDCDYIIKNICDIIIFFFDKIVSKQSINLQDKLFKCSICSRWFYFQMKERGICETCYLKKYPKQNLEQEGIMQRELEAW